MADLSPLIFRPSPPPSLPTMAWLREPRLRGASGFTSTKSMTVTLRIHQPLLSTLISGKYHRSHGGGGPVGGGSEAFWIQMLVLHLV